MRNKKKATMQDVAKLANVSTMTVSRVLSDTGKVKEATSQKVAKAIKELNFTPNQSARNLASSKSRLIAFLYKSSSDSYVGQLLIGALNIGQEQGYNIVIQTFENNQNEIKDNLQNLINLNQVSGIILPPPLADSDSIIQTILNLNLPIIRISPIKDKYSVPFVCIDELQAAFDMTEYLISQNHKKIAFIKGPKDHSSSLLRYQGYLNAMKEHGLAVPNEYLQSGAFTFKSGFEAAQNLLTLKNRPTAIFASNDDMAIATITAAQKHQINVPEMLSVVGFDDAPLATSTWPELTTVRQPIVQMAEKATQLLIETLNPRSAKVATNQNTLNYDLIFRDSVLPPV